MFGCIYSGWNRLPRVADFLSPLITRYGQWAFKKERAYNTITNAEKLKTTQGTESHDPTWRSLRFFLSYKFKLFPKRHSRSFLYMSTHS